MIAFVLNRARKKSGRFDFDRAAFQSLRTHDHRLRPFDVTGDLWKT
jgi:hypothetical protein